jgi:hypothetical protein
MIYDVYKYDTYVFPVHQHLSTRSDTLEPWSGCVRTLSKVSNYIQSPIHKFDEPVALILTCFAHLVSVGELQASQDVYGHGLYSTKQGRGINLWTKRQDDALS